MRLIDADALPKYTGMALSADEVAMAVENAPTIDAIEVVRCKDCEFRNGCESGKGDVCDYSAVYVHPNGFCNWGKRNKDE